MMNQMASETTLKMPLHTSCPLTQWQRSGQQLVPNGMWHTLLALIMKMMAKVSNLKASIGKTGVHLHYHKSEEYNKLTNEQKNELREWHSNNPELAKKQKKMGKNSCNKKLKNTVSKLVAKALNKKPQGNGQGFRGERH